MGEGRSPWQDGGRAWQRLTGWFQDAPAASPGHSDDGDAALDALAAVGLVRHLLDQAELVAVRTARRHGRSWAEIATKLGVTRQSAWERWRELDDVPSGAAPAASPDTGVDDVVTDAAAELVDELMAGGTSALVGRSARSRRSSVTVPNVVGRTRDDARHILQQWRLVAIGPQPDGPPLAAIGRPDARVTEQSPESGARVPAGSSVTLWLEGGGGAGVREPRRPKPKPKSARELRYEHSDEAVG